MYSQLLSVAALLAATAAGKQCYNVTVPVNLESRNAVFNGIDVPMSNLVSFMQHCLFTHQILIRSRMPPRLLRTRLARAAT